MSQVVPLLRLVSTSAAISLLSCTNTAPELQVVIESAGHVPPRAADAEDRGLPSALTRPRVRLEPADLATNVEQHALSVWVESDQLLSAQLMSELVETVRVVKLPERTPVTTTLQPLGHDPRRGDNALQVAIPSELKDGWYELAAGPLPAALEWAPAPGLSYELSDEGTASVRFRIGSEPRAVSVFYCAVLRDSKSEQKVYVELSEMARLNKPVTEHVSIRTQRGPASCHSTQDDLPDKTSDSAQLNFVCSDVRVDDVLTIVLNDAFTSLDNAKQPAPGANETFTFRVGDFSYENPEHCGYYKLRDPLFSGR